MQDEVVLVAKRKTGFNWKIFGIIMTAMAAICLIFGVVMIVLKNNEVARVETECQARNESGSTTCQDGTGNNPVIKAEAPGVYTVSANSSTFEVGGNSAYLNLKLKNGAISECVMNVRDASGIYNKSDCQIDGVVGQIYKIVQINQTTTGSFEAAIGLIATDGTVKYVPLSGTSGNVFSVKGVLHIDGHVVDAIGAEVSTNEYLEGSDWTTLFVLRDGRVLEFNTTMLEGM